MMTRKLALKLIAGLFAAPVSFLCDTPQVNMEKMIVMRDMMRSILPTRPRLQTVFGAKFIDGKLVPHPVSVRLFTESFPDWIPKQHKLRVIKSDGTSATLCSADALYADKATMEEISRWQVIDVTE